VLRVSFYKYIIYKIDRCVSRLRNFLLTGILTYTGFTFDLSEYQSYIYIFYYTVPVTALQIRRSYLSRPRATTLYKPSQYISVFWYIQDQPSRSVSDTHQFGVYPCPTSTPRHYFITALLVCADPLLTRTPSVSRVSSLYCTIVLYQYYSTSYHTVLKIFSVWRSFLTLSFALLLRMGAFCIISFAVGVIINLLIYYVIYIYIYILFI
jgi:hypothetical protein